MSARVLVYVEGGGDSRSEQTLLREGFAALFERVLGALPRPKVIACGGRSQAFRDFKIAVRSHPDALCLLLVDSEGPIAKDVSPWEHVLRRTGDGWARPDGVGDDQLYFMVQAMEAWLLADVDALVRYYGQKFRSQDLPGRRDLEAVDKADLFAALARATRETRAAYGKRHGFELIGKISPERVLERSAVHAGRFFDRLREATAGSQAPGRR